MRRPLVIPENEKLPQDVEDWSRDNVQEFLKANKDSRDLDYEDIEALRQKKVSGVVLLELTEEELKNDYGLEPGAATAFAKIVEQLKVVKGIAMQSPVIPSPEGSDEVTRLAIREDVAIILRDQEKFTSEDITENGITINDSPYTDVNELPGYAKNFVEKLTAKVQYTATEPSNPLIEELKDVLGDNFGNHFVAVTTPENEQRGVINHRQLASYLLLLADTGEEFSRWYHYSYTAIANEANLTSLVVDSAMRILGEPYNRDKVHSNIPIKKSADAEDYETWCPKSDIRVALNEGGSGYTLMTGETQSEGQSEKTATYKNALLSLHSWKVMHKLFGTVDHIILSVFISPFICTIYIFYKDEANNDFIHQGILRQNSMFGSKDKSVEFLRWMHNFAAIAKNHIRNPPNADRTVTQALKAIVPPTRTTNQTATSGNDNGTDGQRNPKRSRTTPGGPSGNNTPADVIEALSDLGFEVHHASHHRDIVLLRRSEGRFVAKRIRRKVELEILEYLKAPHLSRYFNHTVPIIHILHLTSSNHALLVMPFHSVLSQLLRLSERWYYQLRFELVEAVAFLHDLGIVHRDIKPDNLLVDFKAASSPHLFVIDFGIAIWHSDKDQLCVGFHGTEGWTAPEIHEGAQWDPRAAEVWAVGKTLKYMTKLAGHPDPFLSNLLHDDPFPRPTIFDFINQIQRGKRKRSSKPLQKEIPMQHGFSQKQDQRKV